MSLVDYASSDEDDDAEIRDEERDQTKAPKDHHSSLLPPPTNQKSGSSTNVRTGGTPHSSLPAAEKLPDASLLLNSPALMSHLASCSDHSSRVAAAMAENASRKRDTSGVASGFPRRKVPKGNLLHSKNVPDTEGGLLLPPQLKGRSNVVTEDIGKLFVKGQANSSSA